jgi:hypothetical protein
MRNCLAPLLYIEKKELLCRANIAQTALKAANNLDDDLTMQMCQYVTK